MSSDSTNPNKILHDRYRLESLIARGGMGAVFKATDLQTGQTVAVKHLLPEALTTDPSLRARVIREGEALRQLDHPNIVKLLDTFETAGIYHLVLEYVDGGSLAKMIEGYGALPYNRALGLAVEIVDALARAHHLRIIHRDLKPSNILVMSSGTPKLTDFGTALLKNRERLTVGDAMPGGTVEWAAPEVLSGSSADERADIWSLGLVMYTMLAGRHPFQSDRLTETLSNIFGAEPPPLSTFRNDVPEAMDDLIHKMLNKEPQRRPATARLVGAQLETIAMAANTRPPSQPASPATSTSTSEVAVFEPKHNLPAQPTAFIGRAEEAQAVIELLETPSVRLVTLVAPGGMGKTRLALEVAERCVPYYPDGVYFVALAPLSTPEGVVTAMADSIGLTFVPDSDIRQQLLEYLHAKAMLLVVDNFEHVLAGATVIADLLRAAPQLKVLATTREKLDVQGEHLYSLAPLEIPDEDSNIPRRYSAIQLFEQGARRARPSYELTDEDLVSIISICRYVEGVPLGILLAAGWVEALTPTEIAIEIQRDPDFLETTGRDVPERQRSLRATFNYSWKLLNDDERDTLARIAVFHGGFTRDAAQSVAGTSLRSLLALASKSLLRRDPEAGSFSLHEIIRQYAAEKLDEMGLAEAVRLAHSDFYLNQLASRRTAFEGRGQLEAFRTQAAESENLQAAVQYAVQYKRTVALVRAVHAYGLYAEFRSNRTEAQTFAEPVIEVLRGLTPSPERNAVLARALAWYARLSVFFGEQRDAERYINEARALSPSPASAPELEALLLLVEGYVEMYYRSPVEARHILEHSGALYRQIGDRHGLSLALMGLGQACWRRTDIADRDLPRARLCHTEAMDIQRALGDRFGATISVMNLGTVATLAGQIDDARRLLFEARNAYRDLGNTWGMASAQINWASAALRARAYDDARTAVSEALALVERTGSAYRLLWPHTVQAQIELRAANYILAQQLALDTLHSAQALGSEDWAATNARTAADASLALGQYDEAVVRYRLSRESAQRARLNDLVLYCTLGEALALLLNGQPEAARPLFGRVQDKAVDNPNQQSAARVGLGLCALNTQDPEGAVELLTQALGEMGGRRGQAEAEWQDFQFDRWQTLALVGMCDARTALHDQTGGLESLRAAAQHLRELRHPPLVLGLAAAYADVTAALNPPERTAELTSLVLGDARSLAADQARAQHALDKIRLNMSAWALEQAASRGRALGLEEVIQRVMATRLDSQPKG